MVKNAKLYELPSGRDSADALPDIPAKTAEYEQRRHERKRKKLDGLSRQVNIATGTPDYLLIRDESIRRGCGMAHLIRGWIEPHVTALRAQDSAQDGGSL